MLPVPAPVFQRAQPAQPSSTQVEVWHVPVPSTYQLCTADCNSASQGCWGKARKPEARTPAYHEPTFLFQAIFCTGWGPSSSSGKQRKPVSPPPTLLGPFSGLDVKVEHHYRNPQWVGPGLKAISWAVCQPVPAASLLSQGFGPAEVSLAPCPRQAAVRARHGLSATATPLVLPSLGKCSPL